MTEFSDLFAEALSGVLQAPPEGFGVIRASMFQEDGDHPVDWIDFQCAFASLMVSWFRPQRILDIGSYSQFVLGLSAGYEVVSLDIRPRIPFTGETRITRDVRDMDGIGYFEAVTALCSLEHVGLGRYGDRIGLDGDKEAFSEIQRVLKPGGHLIFSVPITGGTPVLLFNAQRNYSHSQIMALCSGMEPVNEKVCKWPEGRELTFDQIGTAPERWDVYCGCWRKP